MIMVMGVRALSFSYGGLWSARPVRHDRRREHWGGFSDTRILASILPYPQALPAQETSIPWTELWLSSSYFSFVPRDHCKRKFALNDAMYIFVATGTGSES